MGSVRPSLPFAGGGQGTGEDRTVKLDIHTHCNTTDPADLERFVRLCESLQTRVCMHSAGPRCDHPYPENDVVRQAVAPYREVDTAFGGFRKLVTLWSNICLNRTPFARIEPHLEAQKASPHTTGFLYMMIHEQYYHPDYVAHIPTFCEGIETAIRWAVGNGYRSAWLEDVVLE